MKKLRIILLLIAINFCSSLGVYAQVKVRVMSYNLAASISELSADKVSEVSESILSIASDVVALQQIPASSGSSESVIKRVANGSLMHWYESAHAGLGVLSKSKPLAVRDLDAYAQVVEFKDFILYNVDFENGVSIYDLKADMSKSTKPIIMAATEVGPELFEALGDGFETLNNVKSLTYPAASPERCDDYLLGYTANNQSYAVPNTKVVAAVEGLMHKSVYADVRLKFPKEKIFRTKPYLQNPVGDGMTIMWLTNTPTYSYVEYGVDTTNLTRVRALVDGQVICDNFIHKIRLENLRAGEKYYYRVCSRDMMLYRGYLKLWGDTVESPFYSFTMQDESQSDFTALIFNDIHQHTDTAKALFENVKDLDYDFVVFNGDCIDDPLNEAQAVRSISELNNIVNASQVPVFYLRGNHEIRNAYSIGLRGLFDYVDDKTYSAFNWGDTRMVLLDAGEDKPDDFWVYYDLNDFEQFRIDQVEFMEREFKSKEFKKAKNRVLIHHIPMHGNTVNKYQPCLPLWLPVLDGVDFDFSINAHTHKFNYLPAGSLEGNTYPVVIGGGYKKDDATVMILSKSGGVLSLKVLDYDGNTILEL